MRNNLSTRSSLNAKEPASAGTDGGPAYARRELKCSARAHAAGVCLHRGRRTLDERVELVDGEGGATARSELGSGGMLQRLKYVAHTFTEAISVMESCAPACDGGPGGRASPLQCRGLRPRPVLVTPGQPAWPRQTVIHCHAGALAINSSRYASKVLAGINRLERGISLLATKLKLALGCTLLASSFIRRSVSSWSRPT